MTERHKKWVYLLAVAVFALLCGGLVWFVGRPMIALAGEPEQFRAWVEQSGLWGKLAYVGIMALQVLVVLIPGEPLELAGGYAFGALWGTVLALSGFVIGSAAVFTLVRRFGVKLVEVFFDQEKIRQMEILKNPKKTKVIAFILMTIPGTPKALISYFAGLTKLTLGQWLTIVAVGRIPSLIGSTIPGGAAGSENYLLAGVIMALSLVISAGGVAYYRKICREQQEDGEEASELPKAS
ncbi:MAG: TVP38/TMEM64 family protein [Oscillospiraceae bacterium]|nr:TVP38/TMEM64 family protein [Oscillospiraceae bacterium]